MSVNRNEMLLRFGFYAGLANRQLGDDSYAKRYLGRAEEITEDIYYATIHEISTRLIAAGKLQPDEDAFETEMGRHVS